MGLTAQGFTPKSLQEIRDDISENLKLVLGNDIDTTPSSRIGQFIDVVSEEIYSAWLALQDVYNSWYPDTSSNTSLDNVVAITNTVRLDPTSSTGEVYLAGASTTFIAQGSTIQKTDTDQNFTTQVDATIPDTSNILICDLVPDSGDITLSWDAEAIATIAFDDSAATIKTTIEGHSKITDVTVIETFDSLGTIHIEFITDTLTSRECTVDSETFERGTEAVTTEPYFSTDDTITVLNTVTGEVTVPQVSLTTIVSSVVGWEEVINYNAGTAGQSRETDAELRERRAGELQQSGTCTTNGIKELVQSVANVENVTIVENDTSFTDVDGREPHSYEVYVTGGLDDDVAQAIYDSKPAGIGVVTTVDPGNQRTGNIVDVNGVADTLIFSEPVPVPMEIVVNITVDSNYPTDGDDQIKEALLAYFSGFELNEDVLNHLLYTPVNTVPGIITASILQDVVGGTPAAANTTIDVEEVATLENSDITVTVT